MRSSSTHRTALAAAAGLLLLCCNNPDAVPLEEPQWSSEPTVSGDELDSTLHGTAHVSCPGDELLTTLGWTTPAGQHQLGEVYFAALDYVGDEPCIALRYDSLLPDLAPQGDQTAEPILLEVDRGLEVDFSNDVPLDVREVARAELTDAAQFRLEGVSAGWLEPDPASQGWPLDSRLRNATYYPFDQFLFIVTRLYSTEQVSLVDANASGDGVLRYPGVELDTSYDCDALPLGDGGVALYDGVFLDTEDGFSYIVSRTDLPRSFCPDLPGSARPPGNGTLTPPQP